MGRTWYWRHWQGAVGRIYNPGRFVGWHWRREVRLDGLDPHTVTAFGFRRVGIIVLHWHRPDRLAQP